MISGELGPFVQLLLGQADATCAISGGRLRSSDAVATRLAAKLFPKIPFWYPAWDNLPSDGTQA